MSPAIPNTDAAADDPEVATESDPGAALIGVCGVTGAGKTVFLTCVFQSIDTVIAEDGLLTFDRKDVGGANYFENVESRIRETGSSDPTRETASARLYLNIDDPTSKLRGRRLPIDLLDFAGKYFSSLADLKALLSHDLPPEEHAAALAVDEFFEKCHGLIILINSRLFDESSRLATENPFPRSVTYLIENCRQRRRPLALVFSQADHNPWLTAEAIGKFERIQRFRQQFTSDLNEALAGTRPYGLVELLACYETEGGTAVKKQSADGSIWRPEAGRVFLSILKAAWPSIRRDLEAAEAKRKQERQQRAAAERRRSRSRARRKRLLVLLAPLAAILLAGSGSLAFRWSQQQSQARSVAEVEAATARITDGGLSSVTPEQIARLEAVWRSSGEAPDGRTGALAGAFARFRTSLEDTAQHFLAVPSLDPGRAGELDRLRAFDPLLEPAGTAWWTPDLVATLEARADFIRAWNAGDHGGHGGRIRVLETNKNRFETLDDDRFADLLAAASTQEKIALVEAWDRDLSRLGNLGERLRRIRTILDSPDQPRDGELELIARKTLARRFAASILELEENPNTEQALSGLAPAVSVLQGGTLRFVLVYRQLQSLDSFDGYRLLKEQLAPWLPAAEEAVWERRLLAQSTLNDLLRVDDRGRRQIWGELIDEVREQYLFETSEEALVGGVAPLPAVLDELLAEGDVSRPTNQALIDALVDRPVYYRELKAVEALIHRRYFRYKVVRAYLELQSRLEADQPPYASLPDHTLEALLRELPEVAPPEEEYLQESRRYFESQEEQLEGVLAAVEKFHRDPSRRQKEAVASYLERLLNHHCNVALVAGTGDCAGVS